MEVLRTSETSANFNETARRYIREGCHLYNCFCQSLSCGGGGGRRALLPGPKVQRIYNHFIKILNFINKNLKNLMALGSCPHCPGGEVAKSNTKVYGLTLISASFASTSEVRTNDWSYGSKRYGFEVIFNGMTFVHNFTEIYLFVHKLLERMHRQTKNGYLISLDFIFKEIRLKRYSITQNYKILHRVVQCLSQHNLRISHRPHV
jgi:hypothetical protein